MVLAPWGGDFGEDGRRSRRLQDKSVGGIVPGSLLRVGVGHGVAAAGVVPAGQLMEYFHRITGPKKQIYLVHGEPLRSLALQSALMEEYPDKSLTVAEMGMTVE